MARTASHKAAIAGTLATLVVVGCADFLTGHEILLSTFYLVPVAMAAWLVGPRFALAISLVSVGAWLAGDLAAGAVYPHAFVTAWNAAIILAFYIVVVGLTRRLRTMQRDLEERVRIRTVALTEEIAERERLEREILEAGEGERRRIGRDLHDSLGQLLTGTALAGQVLHEKLAARESGEAGDAARIVSLVEEAIELTRGLARGLDPVEIAAGGLPQGLRELAARTSELMGTRCEYQGEESVVIEDSIAATHLYRIAQEAIHNAIKHGHAALIAVALEQSGERLRLTVRDDGAGVPDPPPLRAGMGLRIMARRAQMIGGTLEVRRSAPRGTLVTCEVPNP
jgi:signal transduction histidine kinase